MAALAGGQLLGRLGRLAPAPAAPPATDLGEGYDPLAGYGVRHDGALKLGGQRLGEGLESEGKNFEQDRRHRVGLPAAGVIEMQLER